MTSEQQPTLRYDQLSDQTRLRWLNLLKSSRRDITERARRLMTIAVDACDSHGPPALQARLHDGCLWICCQQEDLARLLDCSDRTVRNEFDRLTELKALRQFNHPSKTNVIGYRIELAVLEALPESLTPDLDEIICAFAETSDADVSSGGISGGISGHFSAGVSGHFSGDFSAGVSGLMNHDHEGLKDSYINSSVPHDHESHEGRAARFDAMTDRDIRGIAGFTVEVNGRSGTPTERNRLCKLQEYFADAVSAGHASQDEFRLFAALFRNVGRRTDVKFRPKYLRTLWMNRAEKPLEGVVTASDREYVRHLIDLAQRVPV